MKLGLYIADFTLADGPSGLGPALERYADLGFTVAYGGVPGADDPRRLRAMAERVIPAAAKLG